MVCKIFKREEVPPRSTRPNREQIIVFFREDPEVWASLENYASSVLHAEKHEETTAPYEDALLRQLRRVLHQIRDTVITVEENPRDAG